MPIENTNIISIVVTLITVLGSTAAWDYYKKRMELRKQEDSQEQEEKNLYRDDLKDRVRKLEELLNDSADQKDTLRDKVIALTAEVAILSTKVEYLEKEVSKLETENRLLKG
jgi:septal ring factor EnvC (AmiA/AmiB activator)